MPRFAFLVESGVKWCTIRARPKRMPVVGDHLSLREWCGKPYRSEQRVLCEAVMTRVERILITKSGLVRRDGVLQSIDEIEDLAWADGFKNVGEFFEFFEKGYGLPFEGIVLHWKWRVGV